jgi:hypothetical protein
VKYNVKAFGTRDDGQSEAILFEINITFVNINNEGKKQPIKQEAQPHSLLS